MEDFQYWRKKFRGFKFLIFFDYGIGMIFNFKNLWFSANGINLSEIFFLSLLGMVFSGIFQNVFSLISDRFERRFPFFVIAIISQAIGMLIIAWIPNFLSFVLFMFLWDYISTETLRVVMGYNLIHLSKNGKEDQSTYNLSQEFSKFRVFGSIGFAIAGPLVGYAIDYINLHAGLSSINGALGYQIMYTLCAVLYFVYIVILCIYMRTYIQYEKSIQSQIQERAKTQISQKEEQPIRQLLRNRPYMSIVISQAVFWCASTIGIGAIELFFKNLGADPIFIGWRPFIWAMSELPLFFLSSYMIKKRSYFVPLLLSYQFLTLKLLIYYFVMSPSLIWIDLILQGFNSFGLFYPAMTVAFKELEPKHGSLAMTMNNTVKGLAALVGSGIGMLISAIITSELLAFNVLFSIALIINIGSSIFFVIYWSKLKMDKKI